MIYIDSDLCTDGSRHEPVLAALNITVFILKDYKFTLILI